MKIIIVGGGKVGETLVANLCSEGHDITVIDRSDKAVDQICDLLADRMEEQLMDIQKINFDLSVLAINDPARTAKILGGITGEGNLEHLTRRTTELMMKASAEGRFNPSVPPEDIMKFISSAYSGIQMNCIISACYSKSPMGGYEPRALFRTLARTIRLLIE